MKKKKLSILFLLVLVLLAVTIVYLATTYARYRGVATGTGEVQVAKWSVQVNNQSLVAGPGQVALGTITLTPVANANVAKDRIAPDVTATTEFEIDPTGAEVAIAYEFTLGTIVSVPAGSVPTDFEVTKVEATVGGTTTTVTPTAGKYIGTIELPTTGSDKTAMTATEKVTVKVTAKWTNVEANNNLDTAVGIAAPKLQIPVNVTVKQKLATD